MRLPMPSLQIGDMYSDTPIIQGGMGVAVSLSSLSSAVAEAGWYRRHRGERNRNDRNLIISRMAGPANIKALRSEIRRAREKTVGLIGVNIMVAPAGLL